jgi:soluble lytic murein transglycosylase-like protein
VASEPDWYLRARYPLRYEHIVRGHAENYRLDPALVAAVIYQESKFRPTRAPTPARSG